MSFNLNGFLETSADSLSGGSLVQSWEDSIEGLTSKGTLSLDEIRELLVLSVGTDCSRVWSFFAGHADNDQMLDSLISIIKDEDDYGSGDARIQAAYFMSDFEDGLLLTRAGTLTSLYDEDDGMLPGGCLKPLLVCIVTRLNGSAARQISEH